VLSELDAMIEAGIAGSVYFVDDNFIGNKKAARELLPHLIDWQKRRGFPLQFSCEATLNLAQCPDILAMMREAYFATVFCGIETPELGALDAMKKSHNHVMPLLDAVATLSYVGSRGHDLTAFPRTNTAPPGNYASQAALTAAMPYPRFGTINLYQNIGHEWFNGLQAKLEKRYAKGLTYSFSYALSRDISDGGSDTTFGPTLYAPKNYDRGTSANERRHILTVSGVYELPFGRGKRFGGGMPRVLNGVVGGWQLSSIYRFTSGAPLTLVVPGATLGNGVNARPDIVGDPHLDHPGVNLWFNPAAFAKPPNGRFGNSAPGVITGPADHILDTAFMKNFIFAERKYLQFRWEMFNAMNEVNLGNPVINIGLATTGQITSAGTARQMQFGLKFVF